MLCKESFLNPQLDFSIHLNGKIGGTERFGNKINEKRNLFKRDGVGSLLRIELKKRILINGNIIGHLICQSKAYLKILQGEPIIGSTR
jgi:hypothetical protein